MKSVNVQVPQILEKIKANRDAHKAEFIRATEGYKRVLIADLKRKLEKAEAGQEVEKYINLDAPEDHTSEYDQIIQMLEFSTDETIELTHNEFKQFVMDEWNWSAHFKALSSTYHS